MIKETIVALQSPKSRAAEAYRILRTNLQFASVGKEIKTLTITSAKPGEGKTTTSINLAITLAQAGSKVLLMDCDLRRSMVHKYLAVSNQTGLTNVLAGHSELTSAIQQLSKVEIDVLTAGPIPPNPSELLGSNRMKALLEEVREMYDYVILDCPPAVAVTDGVVLSTIVDGTILVVEAKATTIDLAQQAKENLMKVHCNLLGAVMVKMQDEGEGYYYYYYGAEQEATPKQGKRKSRRRTKRREKRSTA